MPTNLVVFEMSGFDIILGMDWLSKYHASIDCFRKEIVWYQSHLVMSGHVVLEHYMTWP
jgi:hypothetical protein